MLSTKAVLKLGKFTESTPILKKTTKKKKKKKKKKTEIEYFHVKPD